MVWLIWGIYTLVDPCMDFRCKRGKACRLDADLKPACVCQEPTKCPASVNEFDHVSEKMTVFIHKCAQKADEMMRTESTWKASLDSWLCFSGLPHVCRSVGPIITHMTRHVCCLLLNATWREPSEDINCTSTTQGPASVRPHWGSNPHPVFSIPSFSI